MANEKRGKILKFVPPVTDEETRRADLAVLKGVYKTLAERGEDPVPSIVGYLLTEDPTYITPGEGARIAIGKLNRDRVLYAMVQDYLKD